MAPVKRIVNMVRDFLKFRELSQRAWHKRTTNNLILSTQAILDEFANNCLIMDKRDISGISGYLCGHCTAFEFRYINDIGHDRSAIEKHKCNDINPDGTADNKITNRKDLEMQALNRLHSQTNMVFGASKEIVIDRNLDLKFVQSFHGHTIALDALWPGQWLSDLILDEKTYLDDITMRKFLKKASGTYALISVKCPPRHGHYLAYIKTKNPVRS